MDALLFPLLLALLAGFMFLSIRKQKKRVAEQQQMQNSVTTGARVQLTSGLYGTVIDAAADDFVDVEIATGVVTRWNRLAIMKVVPTDEAGATYVGAVPSLPESLDDDVDYSADDEITPDVDTDAITPDSPEASKGENKQADTDK
ncbi:preprotein translocase subunit YajC [Gordonia soli]|uniref:Protein-export membrane protein YajC n=1 Tax=Gordonia soli NBRC 108243 TaxID=1223545 RepID=M0QK61_9ACTN|nr:preprotein translocase subunit YajC [Gordonia soli]GAC68834.1 protein-export membrane protein YajC [Gordonia soli NBRC 108243]